MTHTAPALPEPETRVVLCCYYLPPEAMLARARKLFAGWQGIRFDIYSTNPEHSCWTSAGTRFCPVENEFNDFSSYMRACRDLIEAEDHGAENAAYVFLNDTLFTRHPAGLLLKLLKRALPTVRNCEDPLLAGRADPYRTLLQTSPFAPGLDQYVSTFLFATNRAGVALLHRLFTSEETGEMIRSATLLDFQSRIPAKFSAFLQLHLQSKQTRFSWPGSTSGGNAGRKAVCVLLEHLISAEFFRSGFIFPLNSAMVDILLWCVYRVRGLRVF